MKKKILVTGANGQLGQTIKEVYQKNGIELDFVFVTREDLDITKKNQVEVFFKKNYFNYCINCAAYTNVEQAEKTPEKAYEVNAEAVKNIAKVCENQNVTLIHISTDYVFDGDKSEPYTLNDKTNPINEYGKSKLEGELHIQKVLKHFFIIRTSWLYSKTYGNNFYRTILKKVETETELSITTEQKGCPTNTKNLAKFIIEFIQTDSSNFGIYHFCDKHVMTWFDFAKQILLENKLTNKVNLVKVGNYRTFAKRPKNSVLKT